MSSSKLHQLGTDSSSIRHSPAPSPTQLREPRNQSEPAPPVDRSSNAAVNVLTTSSTTSIGVGKVNESPLSKRSSSVYTLPRDAPIPRLCRVRAYEEQLGFTIAGSKANRGVFKVNDVTPNSPAAHSGLLNDDFIIEISGANVENMTYAEVVQFIKAKKQEDDLQLLVADRATLQWYKAKKVPISSQVCTSRCIYFDKNKKVSKNFCFSLPGCAQNAVHRDFVQRGVGPSG
jgi:hypothetical protein